MNKQFQRAKSKENKKIRLQQIMDVTDHLFETHSYHEITLSTISAETGLARGGLYKYVSSKEEIFLSIYAQKEKAFNEEAVRRLSEEKLTHESFAQILAESAYDHLDYIKYHQILNAIIESNVSVEKLAQYKKESAQYHQPLFEYIGVYLSLDPSQVFDFYLTVLYHCVYLYDRVAYSDRYVEAMKLAELNIEEIDFIDNLKEFILKLIK